MSRVRRAAALPCVAVLLLSGCERQEVGAPALAETSLYELVIQAPGVAIYPPFGPAPISTGTFDPTILAELSVRLEETAADGATIVVATWDATTTPRLQLLAQFEVYYSGLSAGAYFTNPTSAYRFRVLARGRQLAMSDVSSRIFDFIAQSPSFVAGVKLRIEQGALNCLEGAACDDGDPCTTADVCRSGVCRGSTEASLVPVLSANDSASPIVVSASTEHWNQSLQAWKAFNHDASGWPTGFCLDQTTGWLEVDLGAPRFVTKYRIRGRDDILAASPMTWTFQGSADHVHWYDLSSVSGMTNWPLGQFVDFPIASPAAFRWFRIDLRQNGGYHITCFQEMELIDGAPRCGACTNAGCESAGISGCGLPGPCDAATGACTRSTATDGSTCDDADACTLFSSCSAGVCVGSNSRTLVPVLTANDSARPLVVSASTEHWNQSLQAWKAFNHDASGWPTGFCLDQVTGWLEVDFGAPTRVTRYSLRGRDDVIYSSPSTWSFSGSNDRQTWTRLSGASNVTDWVPGAIKTYPVGAPHGYRYYRIDMSANGGYSLTCLQEVTLDDDSSVCEASCDDGLQNQGETGIDCGGPCAACPVTFASCRAILDAGRSTGDGVYTLDLDGPGGAAPFSAFCDMTRDGGGWTLVLRGVTGDVPSGWFSSEALSPERAATSGTFKLSDDTIDRLRAGGIYRLDSTGAFTATRFVSSACRYTHSAVSSGACNTTYPTAALTSGSLSGIVSGNHRGISDWTANSTGAAYFIVSHWTLGWHLGPSVCGGTFGPACTMTMWVR